MTRAEVQQITLRRDTADPLPVMESFYTIQGEGTWTGTAAYFVRLAGCDVGCFWCDVKESWAPSEDQYQTSEEIVREAKASGAKRVVITGGEPTIYDLTVLTDALHRAGLIVHIETAGPYPLRGDIDWVCLSPKKFLVPRADLYERVNELKVIIYNDDDFRWAEEHAALCPPHTQLFLQPEWSRRERNYPKVLDYVMAHPHWRLSMQTHKYLDIR
ncbi:MAG: radical SAM protein [Bacteroidia bacterium]|nr:radical SAM protein [Bacteroidia bacterium]